MGEEATIIRRINISVYDKPPPAVGVLAKAMGVSRSKAIEGLRALIEAGYGIGPREPTNGMLAAYIETTTPPRHHQAVITAVGKARARWQAMLAHGTEMAFSRKYVTDESDVTVPPISSCGENGVATPHTPEE